MVRVRCETSIAQTYGLKGTVECGMVNCSNRITIREAQIHGGFCAQCYRERGKVEIEPDVDMMIEQKRDIALTRELSLQVK